tara:strand:- start:11147 stop:12055 length:909 start_codon:yes stop_codon:yes gene_type:complete
VDLSKLVSVFVPTHIIRASTEPYIENQMILETILQSHKRLNLGQARFFVYPDAKFKRTHPDLSRKYYEYLNGIKLLDEFKDINITIVDDTRETMRNNWLKFIEEDCKTPYMLFLEHDWGFKQDIDLKKIINTFEQNDSIGYIKFNRFPHDERMKQLASPNNWDWIFEQDKLSGMPLFKITFFSGNPHIARIRKCKEFYIPRMMEHCPPEKSKGTSHLEKDLKKAELRSIDSFRDCGFSNHSTDGSNSWGHKWPLSSGHKVGNGCEKCEASIRRHHKEWGLYMIGQWGDDSRVFHLGEWCRKQ